MVSGLMPPVPSLITKDYLELRTWTLSKRTLAYQPLKTYISYFPAPGSFELTSSRPDRAAEEGDIVIQMEELEEEPPEVYSIG